MKSNSHGLMLIGLGGAGRTMCEYMSRCMQHSVRYLNIDKNLSDQCDFRLDELIGKSWKFSENMSGDGKKILQCLDRRLSGSETPVFVVGLGGKTGTKLFSDLAILRPKKALSFVCFLPFNFEGNQRCSVAEASLRKVNPVNKIYLYPNQDLFIGAHPNESFTQAFERQAAQISAQVLSFI